MLNEEWVTDGWEEIDPGVEKRPARRYYELTDKGRVELASLLQAASAEKRFYGLFPRTAW